MNSNELIVSIEVAPENIEEYLNLSDEERNKKLNPIDSKIILIATKIKSNNEIKIFRGNEKEIISNFWKYVEDQKVNKFIGFNIKNFDFPFITTRSFINNIKIAPFTLNKIIDLRELINAFRYGYTRGRLREFADILQINLADPEFEATQIPQLYYDNKFEELEIFITNNIKILEELYNRAEILNFTKISRF